MIMIKKDQKDLMQHTEISDLDNLCEVCKKKDKSVTQYLILTGYKICKSCWISKTIFPI